MGGCNDNLRNAAWPVERVRPGSSSIAICCLLIVMSVILPNPAKAGSVLVVVSDVAPMPVPRLSEQEIVNLFLSRRLSRTIDLTPMDREDPLLRDRFYQITTGMSQNRLRAYWARRVFTGRGRPPKNIPEGELDSIVRDGKPVITYAEPGRVPDGTKVIYELVSE